MHWYRQKTLGEKSREIKRFSRIHLKSLFDLVSLTFLANLRCDRWCRDRTLQKASSPPKTPIRGGRIRPEIYGRLLSVCATLMGRNRPIASLIWCSYLHNRRVWTLPIGGGRPAFDSTSPVIFVTRVIISQLKTTIAAAHNCRNWMNAKTRSDSLGVIGSISTIGSTLRILFTNENRY